MGTADIFFMGFQERFQDDPVMVEKLMSILQAVIKNEIASCDAREQFEDLLGNPEYNDLLQLLLCYIPVGEVIPPDNFSVDGEDMENGDDEVSLVEPCPSIELAPSKSKEVQQKLRQNQYENQKYRRFSNEEKAQIIDGLKRFGQGTKNIWRRILGSYKFNNRSAVDIKDAFRNMKRAAWREKRLEMDQRTPSKRCPMDFTPFVPQYKDQALDNNVHI
jgi:hypothetical protein